MSANCNWISVEDDLPTRRVWEDDEPVEYLGLLKHGVVPTVVCIDERDEWFVYEFYSQRKEYLKSYEAVTHWMPMPKVPESILESRK